MQMIKDKRTLLFKGALFLSVLMLLVAGLFLIPISCNDTPVRGITGPFTVVTNDSIPVPEIPKIDILWVVDNSTSMCEEQNNLVSNFNKFIDAFKPYNADIRIAVTTTDADNKTAAGKFRTKPGTFGSFCQPDVYVACDQGPDPACIAMGDLWHCLTPGGVKELPNGQINSRCQMHCGSDSCKAQCSDGADKPCMQDCGNLECSSEFSVSYDCFNPGGSDSYCKLLESTGDCPTGDIGPIIKWDTTSDTVEVLKNFRCIATVGTETSAGGSTANLEQGLQSAKLALDINGINKAYLNPKEGQTEPEFLRPDAYLVIIIVSDEDDCSHKPGVTYTDSKKFATCALYSKDLVPVAKYVQEFKGLKENPGYVLVAALDGDSLKTDPTQIDADRQAYLTSKMEEPQTYICISANGKADFGMRYLELTTSFGSTNGKFANICQGDFGPSLQDIADAVGGVVQSVCLTREVKVAEGTVEPNLTWTDCKDFFNSTDLLSINLNDTANPNYIKMRKCLDYMEGFINVEITPKDGAKTTLDKADYEIRPVSKCGEDEEGNPYKLGVWFLKSPTPGSLLDIVYLAEVVSNASNEDAGSQ